MNRIIKCIIPTQVKVRKYNVDIVNLKQLLHSKKQESKLTNKQIAIKLNKPLTLVEHWFRQDNSFSIPSEDVWLNLKHLLSITTNEFDKSILEFEIKDGVYDKSNRVYDVDGIAPTLTCDCEHEKFLINKLRKVDEMKEFTNKNLIKYNFNMPTVRLFDAFAGIGALHSALKHLGIPIKITNLSEVDIDAIISYACIHIENFIKLDFNYPSESEMREWLIERNIGYDFVKQKSRIPRLNKDKLYKVYKASILLHNLGDISKIDYEKMEDFDLFNLSFSCQDLSVAGKQQGMTKEDGTPTRSGMVVYGLQIIRQKKPKYIMIENVKGLIQKKFINDFYSIINELKEIGYNCYYSTKEDKKGNKIPTCLNAKNYGIPQNRERIYVICVREDIDNKNFEFPKGFDLGIRLKDILEDEVEEKYYLDKKWHYSTEEDGKHDVNEIAQLDRMGYKATRSIGDPNKICRCLDTMGGGNREPKILENIPRPQQLINMMKNQIDEDIVPCDSSINKPKKIEVANCITARYDAGIQNQQSIGVAVIENMNKPRVRKLTPKECWRLMGFIDVAFEKAKASGLSDSALYKQAGNSIVVNVLYYIFKELFKDYIE